MSYRSARTDYPDGVIAIYDNRGRTIDRYTVVYAPYDLDTRDVFAWTHMSADPYAPQGVCQHGDGYSRPYSGWGTSNRNKVIAFEALPKDCQRVVRQDLEA